MRQENQTETITKNKLLVGALALLMMFNGGCRLVDGQDQGADSLILNSMAISATCDADAYVAQSYSCKPNVSISDQVDMTHLTWELTPEHSCSWMEINPTTGQVFGVPPREQMGNCVIALRVVTSEKPSSDFVQQISVHGPKISFIDKNCGLTAPIDKPYLCDLEATTPLAGAHMTYSLAPDNRCAWASVNPSTGDVTGTPTLGATGFCLLSVKAAIDTIASSVSQMLIIIPKIAVTVSASCSVSVDAGTAYSCAPTASAPVTLQQFSWSLSSTNTCSWAVINPTSGVISGSPLIQSAGSCRLDFTAKLADGSAGQTSMAINIATKGYTQMQLLDLNSDARENAGQAVAIDGNFAVVGSPDDNGGAGSVAVYQFDGTTWRKNSVFVSPDPKKIQSFGYAVSISGSSILVGAPSSSVSQFNEGAVVAYEWNGSSWSQTQILTPSTPVGRSLMYFGASVRVSGSRALVATSHYNADAAYVLNKNGSTWTLGPSLTFPAINSADGAKRIKVALQGSLAAVSDTSAGANQYGEVHMFSEINGVWTPSGTIVGTGNSQFGASVDIFNNKILIGDPGERSNAGAAYLYEPGQSAWIQTKSFRAVDESAGQYCGASVSLNAAQVAIGCSSTGISGSAYIYSFQSSIWNLTSKITATNGQANDNFGESVGISGTNVLIGAGQFDGPGGIDSGTAYLFRAKN